MDPEHQILIHQILDFADKSGYRSFSIGKFCHHNGNQGNKRRVEKAIEALCSRNRLVQLGDGRFISAKEVNEIKDKIKAHIAENGRLTIEESKEVLGQGRQRGIPILDYLDAVGFTVREGNVRILKGDV